MFSFIKDKLKSVFSQVTSKLSALFLRKKIDEETLKELELILLTADTGIKTTRIIIKNLQEKFRSGQIQEGHELKDALKQELLDILNQCHSDTSNFVKATKGRSTNSQPSRNAMAGTAAVNASSVSHSVRPDASTNSAVNASSVSRSVRPELVEGCERSIFLLVGINGSGKTTFAGKLAYKYAQEGKKVLLVAADTFRAAAPEQLSGWAQKTGATIHIGKPNQDPASVVFTGCQLFKQENFDVLIIDTAGRLQTKINLMKELEKIKRVTGKNLPDQKITTLLTVDSMLGQNSFEQAKLFHEATELDGIVLTKMDGTGKGGIVFSIAHELRIPISYITFGEAPDKLKLFDANEYVQELVI